jgi:hypothetical protein
MSEKLKAGQKITVRLTDDHQLEGDHIDHAAQFLRMHADGEWADVELQKEHAGGVRRLSVPLSQIVAAVLLLLALATPGRAQFVGYTSPQTVSIKVFSAQSGAVVTPNNSAVPCVATNGNPCAVENLGQNMHFLSYTVSGSIQLLDMRIEGSNDGINFFAISDDAIDVVTPSGVLFAVGYYPFIRVNLAALTGGGNITANYSGTSSTSSPALGAYTTGMQTRKLVFSRVSQGSNQSATILSPSGSTSGYLVLVLTQGGSFPGGSSISVSNIVGNSGFIFPLSQPISTGQSVLPVSAAPASSVTVTYTSGGASGNDFNAWYVFSPPFPSVDPCQSPAVLKSSAVITAPAATTTQIVSAVANQAIYVCGYNIGVVVAAAGTVQWTTGTGGTCAVNTVVKTGAIPVNTATPFSFGPGATLFSSAPSSAVCITLTGAGDNAAGVLTYVQQ